MRISIVPNVLRICTRLRRCEDKLFILADPTINHMKLFIRSLLFIVIGWQFGCSSIRIAKMVKRGNIRQENFKIEVPFEMRLGLLVLKVEIHGKTYDFILDTGAPNAISKDAAQEIGLK